MTIHDEELRVHFDDLRAEDLATTPAFDVATVGSRRRRSTTRWWLAAAAMIAMVAGAVMFRVRARHDAAAQIRLDVLNWRAPTDALLRDSRTRLGGSPSVFGSVLDGAAAGAMPTYSSTRGNGI